MNAAVPIRDFASERWPLVQLSEVAEHCLGKMLDARRNKGRMLPYLRNPNVRWFDIDVTAVQTMPFEPHEDERYGLRAGDVLVCEGGEAGRAAIWDGRLPEVKFQKAIHRVRPGPRLDARYLVHQLMKDYHTGRLADYYTGATIKHLTGQDLARYRFALPPLDIQRRMVAILDKAHVLRARRRAALAQVDSLTQSLFLEMFGNPATNPKQIRKQALGELIRLKSGNFLPASEMARSGLYPVFGGNGVAGSHDKYMFDDAKVVIGRVGAYCGCIHASPPKSWITDNALYISELSPDLHFNYLVAALELARLNQYAGKSGQPLVSGARIYPVQVLIPDRQLQQKFAQRVERVAALRPHYETALKETNELWASLQQRAFSGAL
jgi:type I restriction enzyme S subunit